MNAKSGPKTSLYRTAAIFMIVMLALVALPISPASAAACTFTSNATGNWNANIWTITGTGCGTYPGQTFAGDTVNISNGNVVTVNVSPTNSIGSLTFPSGNNTATTVNINSGITLNVSGTVTIPRANGVAINTLAVGAGTLSTASIAFTNGGGTNRHQLTISTGTVTVTGDVTQTGSTGSATIAFTGAGLLKLGGAFLTSATGTLTIVAGSTVEYNGAAQTVGDFTYNNLTLSGSGNKTMPAAVVVNGNMTLSGTATTTTAAAMTIGGNLDVGTGTTFTIGPNFTLGVTGTTSVTGTLTLGGTGTKTFTGNVTINNGGIWNETGVASINYAGNLQNDGTFTANTGTHTFSGATKTISGANAIAIPNATFTANYTNSGTLSVSTVLTVTGAAIRLTNNGTITATASLAGTGGVTQGATGVLNIGGASTITTLDASTNSGNTVNYNGAAQAVRAITYSNLIFSGSLAKTVAAGTSVSGNLSIAPTGTATANINARP